MKIKIIVILLMGLIASSCKDFLEEKPLSLVTAENFYNTDKDLEQAVNAVYSHINFQWRENMIIYGDLFGDDITSGPVAENAWELVAFDNFTFDAFNGRVRGTWEEYYKSIDNANVVIEKAPLASAAQAVIKQRVVAEAYFLRAYSYYCLVRLFGEVPLKTESTKGLANLTPAKNTVSEIYAQIVSDLQVAAGETGENPGLPLIYEGANNGRVTLGAAHTLLAEVQLTNKDWASAAAYAKKVIDGNRYALFTTYEEAFLYTNKFKGNTAPNGEAIWEAQFNQDVDPGNPLTRWIYPRSGVQGFNWGGVGNYVVPPDTYDNYDDNDERKNHIFPDSYTNDQGQPVTFNQPTDAEFYAIKWTREGQPTAVWGWDANNQPILRYADALLIYAEAANELSGPTSEAYVAINAVRIRAELPALAGLNKDSFREAVYEERRHEFLLEGKRHFDLVRTGRFVSALTSIGINVSAADERLPIPQSEIDLNPKLAE